MKQKTNTNKVNKSSEVKIQYLFYTMQKSFNRLGVCNLCPLVEHEIGIAIYFWKGHEKNQNVRGKCKYSGPGALAPQGSRGDNKSKSIYIAVLISLCVEQYSS